MRSWAALCEFSRNGIPYVREDDLRVFYDGVPLKTHYRADFACFDRQYIVGLKDVKNLTRVEWAQVVHYMRATGTPYGLLLNFGRPQFQYDTFDKESLPKIFNDRGGLGSRTSPSAILSLRSALASSAVTEETSSR